LLRVERVGIDDSFFELGGHSLLIVRAHAKLAAMTSRELSITDLFRHPTIRALAQFISQDVGDDGRSTVGETVDRAQSRREAMIQRRQRRQRARIEATDDTL
jgi:hypothetical protein